MLAIGSYKVPLCGIHEAEHRLWQLSKELRLSPLIACKSSRLIIDRDHYIYAAGRLPEGPVKIGCSTDPKHRIFAIRQKTNGRALELLAISPGNFALENTIHKALQSSLLEGREWYRPTPEVLNFVAGLAMIGLDDSSFEVKAEMLYSWVTTSFA